MRSKTIIALGLIGLVLLGGCGGSGNTAITTVPTAHLAITLPTTTVTAGTPFTFTVKALDAMGAVIPTYTGTVHITTSDTAAKLPADATLAQGVGTFTATFNTTGNQTITASDTVGDASHGISPAVSVKPIPVPTIASLSPGRTVTAGAGFPLIVNGSNFVLTSVVRWNGSNRSTAFVSSTQVTAQISAADIATAGAATVTVFNPAPGGGSSNSSTFTITTGTGRFAYAANAGDNTISVYSIDSTTGALTAVGAPVPTGASPYAIAGRPDAKYVYVVNEISNNISAYAVNATSGALTAIPGSPFAAGMDPKALTFDPSGAYLYVANHGSDNLSAYVVNASTGALTPQATATYITGSGPSAVSVDSSGQFVFVANNGGSNNISVFAMAAGTGALTPVAGSPFAAGGNPHSLAVTPYGTPYDYGAPFVLYTANFDGTRSTISGFSVDSDTGALTALSGSPFAVPVSNYIGTDFNGDYLYVTTGASVVGYSIDENPPIGLLEALPGFPVASGTNAYSVTVDRSNQFPYQFLYVGNDGSANISGYKLDSVTGGLTAILGSPFAAGSHPDFIAIL